VKRTAARAVGQCCAGYSGDYDLVQYLPDADPLERSMQAKSLLVHTRTRHPTQLFELGSSIFPEWARMDDSSDSSPVPMTTRATRVPSR
jgi:hypothetical protein